MSFEQSIVLELCKAVFTAIFVAGGAGVIVWRFQANATQRAQNLERERSEMAQQRQLAAELERDKRALKTNCVNEVTASAGSFYFQTQRFWRQTGHPDIWGEPQPHQFDQAYVSWAPRAEAIESELGARYGWNSRAEALWHQVRDLLTIRYFDLRGRNSEGLRQNNCRTDEKLHSGLTADELLDRKTVLRTYHLAMQGLTQELISADITA
jgi:hypothetical protein